MKFTKKDLLFLIVPLIIVAVIYPFLPPQIPRQFGFNGEVRYMDKGFIFLIGLLPYVIYKYLQARRK